MSLEFALIVSLEFALISIVSLEFVSLEFAWNLVSLEFAAVSLEFAAGISCVPRNSGAANSNHPF